MKLEIQDLMKTLIKQWVDKKCMLGQELGKPKLWMMTLTKLTNLRVEFRANT
jgi:hypothetical protein